jgi:predicted TIM-barrel fold metal-dependent hydrolase
MIIDCNANLGNWPFRRTTYNDPASLIERLERVGIEGAWVTLLDAVMYKNVHAGNAPLAEMVADYDALLPVATVNPMWPAWEKDLAECAGALGFRGVRVNPNYHGYELGDAVFEELLTAAGELGMFVEVAARMTDERHHHPLVMVPPTDLSPLLAAVTAHPEVAIVVANGKNAEATMLCRSGDLPANLYVEMSHIESVGGVKSVADAIGVERMLFGTHAPYFYPESSQLKVFTESELTDAELAAISHENAERLLG